MSEEEVAKELNDPFAVLLLRAGTFPANVHEVLDSIKAATKPDDPLHKQQLPFLVGEGSQIPFSQETASVARGLRLAVACGRDSEVDVLVSTAATGDLAERFLQVMGWDKTNGVFHYYERKRGVWVWAGNSFHSLDAPSRGQGPFDSHVNGSMVMKELKLPWTHWHSVSASVPPEVLAPGDPAAEDPLFTGRGGAEFFEQSVVKPGVRRWTDARLAKTTAADGTVKQVPQLLRQLVETTTVNLTSTGSRSGAVAPEDTLALPPTFFVDADTLSESLQLPAPQAFPVSGQIYRDSLAQFEFALIDGDFHQPGDAHFAFFVPERAFEDIAVVNKCLQIGLISDRFVACVLMIDFANPIFSSRRAQLLKFVPETAQLAEKGGDLPGQIAAAIEKASKAIEDGSPEGEFLANWRLGDKWRPEFEQRLGKYYEAVAARTNTTEGFADYVRLAESRRRRVRQMELSEGRPLLFAQTNIPADAPALVMQPDATVVEVQAT